MQLPALGFNPQNALIDFSPVNNAIDGNRKNALMQRENDRQDQEFALKKDQFGYQRGRDQVTDQRASVKSHGEQATAIDQTFPVGSPNRAVAFQRLLAAHNQEHPGEHLTPEEMDPATGPRLMAAQAGMFLDPNKAKLDQANLSHIRAQTADTNSQAAIRGKTLALEKQKMQMMNDYMSQPNAGQSQQPPAQQPSLPGTPRQASDGNWYVSDPQRPGKYLMVKP